MSDLVRHHSLDDDLAEAALGGLLDTRPCPKCLSDLCSLPKSARYCPHCGWDLQQPPAMAVVQERPTTPDDPFPHPPTVTPPGDNSVPGRRPEPIRSPILRGFATALYRLGARYERGLGASYNSDEAQRCYFKAAKLGNSAAIARLRGSSEIDDPSNDPPQSQS